MVKTLRSRSGEKPHGLRFGIPNFLPHSIPQPPQPVLDPTATFHQARTQGDGEIIACYLVFTLLLCH